MTDFLLVVTAYLTGSVSFGQVAARIRRTDLVSRDVPGGSGVFRQLGPAWGITVALLDLAKGALTAWASSLGESSWLEPLMAAALVAGHNWPLYFGFRGGGGIAPTIGFFGWLFPTTTLSAVAVGLLVMLLYWRGYWIRNRTKVYPAPVAAMVAYLMMLVLLRGEPAAFYTFLLVSVLAAIRGIRIMRNKW